MRNSLINWIKNSEKFFHKYQTSMRRKKKEGEFKYKYLNNINQHFILSKSISFDLKSYFKKLSTFLDFFLTPNFVFYLRII